MAPASPEGGVNDPHVLIYACSWCSLHPKSELCAACVENIEKAKAAKVEWRGARPAILCNVATPAECWECHPRDPLTNPIPVREAAFCARHLGLDREPPRVGLVRGTTVFQSFTVR